MAYRILEDRCVGCGACAWACLFDVPRLREDSIRYTIDEDKCVGCGQCEKLCPNSAIEPCPDHRVIRRVTVVAEKCIGCSRCSRVCKAKAPHGVIKQPFVIDEGKCFRCGVCASNCPRDAILVEYAE